MNTLQLNAKEARVMAALIEHGCTKSAARALDMNQRTLEGIARGVREKMAEKRDRMPSRLQAAVLFDRLTRESEPA